MVGTEFSRAILKGLRLHGLRDAEILRIAKITQVQMKKIMSEAAGFTDAQILRIEKSVGRTGGQLAASAVEPEGGPLTDLFEQWAEISGVSEGTAKR